MHGAETVPLGRWEGVWGAMPATDKQAALLGVVLAAVLGVLTVWATFHA